MGSVAMQRFPYSHLAPEPKTPIFAALRAAKIGVLGSDFGEKNVLANPSVDPSGN